MPLSQVPQSMIAGGPAFSAYASAAAQSVATSTNTKITFDAEEFDTNSNFASSRFTPTVPGYYQVNATAYMTTGTGGTVNINLYKNGTAYKFGSQTATAATGTIVTVSALVYMNGTTDYLEAWFFQTTGGPQTLNNNAASTYFNGALVRSN